jgi:DNA modification methylase
VNFRNVVSWLKSSDRATHFIHPYPAKLLAHIPNFFVNSSLLSASGDVVLDPFCGSGTVLLEAALAGRNALGADANPLARLVSKVKTTPIRTERVRRALRALLDRIPASASPPVAAARLTYWFYPHVISQLSRLRFSIDRVRDADVRDFLLVCFSSVVRRVSLADPRLSVPVRLRADQYTIGHWLREKTELRLRRLRRQDVIREFEIVVAANLTRMESLVAVSASAGHAVVISNDARRLTRSITGHDALPSNSVDLIITSPPYMGAQKYVRASSLSLAWLGFLDAQSQRAYEELSIGREHFQKDQIQSRVATGISWVDADIRPIRRRNALRGHLAAIYILEMAEAINESARVLRPGGHLVLVASNNRVCGRVFRTQAALAVLAERAGFVPRLRLVDAIRSRGLMTRRNATAGVITREWIHVLEKPS